MRFRTNVPARLIDGIGRRGYVTTTYQRLRLAFGEPESGVDGKTRYEWSVQFEDDVIAVVYDWKSHADPGRGEAQLRPTEWNIGGRTPAAVDRVREVVEQLTTVDDRKWAAETNGGSVGRVDDFTDDDA